MGWTEQGALTVFPSADGLYRLHGDAAYSTEAYPHPDDHHYHVIAHRCGYGDDLLAYCREHELAHALVAQCIGASRPSTVLWHQARMLGPAPVGLSIFEEIAAQALQRWVRANERPILAGADWDAIKLTFLGYAEALGRELEVSRETR